MSNTGRQRQTSKYREQKWALKSKCVDKHSRVQTTLTKSVIKRRDHEVYKFYCCIAYVKSIVKTYTPHFTNTKKYMDIEKGKTYTRVVIHRIC